MGGDSQERLAGSVRPENGDADSNPAIGTRAVPGVPSSAADEPERASFSDPLPARAHALDPGVSESEESKEQAPPSPEWLKEGREGSG